MLEEEHVPVAEKALVMARIEAMRASVKREERALTGPLWTVRPYLAYDPNPLGSEFRDTSLCNAVLAAHYSWVESESRHRAELIERAKKFKLTEVSTLPTEYEGVLEAPESHHIVLGHLYDLLHELSDEGRVRVGPEWREDGGTEGLLWSFSVMDSWIITAPNLKKLCNRVDARLHKNFMDARESILRAAKATGLLDVEPVEPEVEPDDDLPMVVARHVAAAKAAQVADALEASEENSIIPMVWLVFASVLVFGGGVLVGLLLADTTGM